MATAIPRSIKSSAHARSRRKTLCHDSGPPPSPEPKNGHRAASATSAPSHGTSIFISAAYERAGVPMPRRDQAATPADPSAAAVRRAARCNARAAADRRVHAYGRTKVDFRRTPSAHSAELSTFWYVRRSVWPPSRVASQCRRYGGSGGCRGSGSRLARLPARRQRNATEAKENPEERGHLEPGPNGTSSSGTTTGPSSRQRSQTCCRSQVRACSRRQVFQCQCR